MRPVRAFALAGCALLALVSSGVPMALAGGSRWAGSGWDAPIKNGYRNPDPELTISGTFVYDSTVEPQPAPAVSVDEVVLTIEPTADYTMPDGCTVPEGETTEYPPGEPGVPHEAPFLTAVTFPCNGRFLLTAMACTAPGCEAPQDPQEWHELYATVDIAAPPGPVPGLEATTKGRTVTLSWDPLAVAELDAAGFAVERATGDAAFTMLQRTTKLTYTDQAPAEGGRYRYRVRALRSAPDGFVATDPGSASVATVEVPPAVTWTVPPGRSSSGFRSSGTTYRPRISLQTPRVQTSDTVDGGFGEFLPYDDVEPGGDDPVLPDEAASVLYEEDGAGVLVPVASALVLVMWAVHLRYLNRLAKR